jgi:hypothetical protein
MIRLPVRRSAVLAALLAASACSDLAGVRVGDVIGSYEATILVAEGQDVLAAGGSLTLSLEGNGLMSGTLNLPASVSGGPLDVDLSGTWSLVDRTVLLFQNSDTFVKQAVWVWTDGVIEGTCCGTSTTITVRMEPS